MAVKQESDAMDIMVKRQVERRGNVPPSDKRYYYRTYGLTIASQIELPEISPIEPCFKPDVVLLTPGVDEELEAGAFRKNWLEIGVDKCQINIGGIARYRVEHGQRILLNRRISRDVDSIPDPGDVRLFLLGSAFGALLHQRHWLPLHVSALSTPSGVWAFTGQSGAGKSTLGAWLHYTKDWPMVSDDVAVIKPEDDQPYLYPGPPRLKLWKDALTALGIGQRGLVQDLTRADKYHVLLQQGFQLDPLPLRGLVLLERADENEPARLEPVTGVVAFQSVMSALYRPEMVRLFNNPVSLLQSVSRLTESINVYRYKRPWSLNNFDKNLHPLLQCLQ